MVWGSSPSVFFFFLFSPSFSPSQLAEELFSVTSDPTILKSWWVRNAQAFRVIGPGKGNEVFAPNKPDCGTACKLCFDLSLFFGGYFFSPPPFELILH